MAHTLSRRRFVETAAIAAAFGAYPGRQFGADDGGKSRRKMTLNLVCGNIGVSANQSQAVELAHRHGFESVEARGEELAAMSAEQLAQLQRTMRGIVFGAAGLPVDFRGDEAKFDEGMKRLPVVAAGLKRVEVTRVGTWLPPASDSFTYLQNFKRHTQRLRAIALVLQEHGQRLGLEYVGTPSSRVRRRFSFVHTMTETRELIEAIGTGNVGLVLDTWHWWTAGETVADILSLKHEQIVAVDVNDAPAGIPVEAQQDGKRELPLATGVIDVGGFLNALQQLGYDGPVRAEPFNKSLNDLDNEAACAATAQAMKKAFELVRV